MEGWITLATVVAAIAAVWLGFLNQRLVRIGQAQVAVSQEQLRNQQRPVLIPVGMPIFQEDHDNWLKWEGNEQPLAIRNLGTGTAFNVASVLYGCTSYLHDGPSGPTRFADAANQYWTCWLGVPIAPAETENATLMKGHGTFKEGNTQIGDYSFNAPDEPMMAEIATQGALWRSARVTITYSDIAGRRYASIFDYVRNRGWHMVAALPDITRDLHDLEGYHRPAAVNTSPAGSEGVPTRVI